MRLFIPAFVVLGLVSMSSGLASAADESNAQSASPAQPGPTSPPSSVDVAGGAEPAAGKKLDFDFFADEKQAGGKEGSNRDADEVAARASRRRWMLKTHQILGLTTWALMAATVVVGQLNYNQLYGGGGGSTKWQGKHQALIASTTVAFAGTGAFALFAPKPYDRPLQLDTGLVHRIAVAGATLGMVSEIVLGVVTSRRADAGNPRSLKTLARTHQIIGYSTFGMLTVAATVWVF
jgi:hypothetical protein